MREHGIAAVLAANVFEVEVEEAVGLLLRIGRTVSGMRRALVGVEVRCLWA